MLPYNNKIVYVEVSYKLHAKGYLFVKHQQRIFRRDSVRLQPTVTLAAIVASITKTFTVVINSDMLLVWLLQ